MYSRNQFLFSLFLALVLFQILGIVGVIAGWAVWQRREGQQQQQQQTIQLELPFDKASITSTHLLQDSPEEIWDPLLNLTKMSVTATEPHLVRLGPHGYVQGLTLLDNSGPLAHYFGGLRYALPPRRRWAPARPLPLDYVYGTESEPGRHDGQAQVCPQPGNPDTGSEDCFQLNVWVPIDRGDRPKEGWPVIFYIHGGFLQMGSPNGMTLAPLLNETDVRAVVVAPAYRLAVLGFLSSAELRKEAAWHGEPVGNQGFWDQRAALEWTHRNARYFGGNPDDITIAGYSAGSYSVFHQLAHDLYLPDHKSIVRRAIMWSNGPGVHPKSAENAQEQFNELLRALGIPLDLKPSEKLDRLRKLPARTVIEASVLSKHHQYRPWDDGAFISRRLFRDLNNGDFARRMIRRGVRLMIGECSDEHFVYQGYYTPSDSLQAVRERLKADYPPEACDALVELYYPDGKLPPDSRDWKEAFGKIYADIQIHMMERGLVYALARGGAAHLIYRYRVEFRLQCIDRIFPPEWGVTHTTDLYMWLWGNGQRLKEHEKPLVRKALVDPLAKFIHGDYRDMQWGTSSVRQARRMREDGSVDVWEDTLWSRGVTVWKTLLRAFGDVRAKL